LCSGTDSKGDLFERCAPLEGFAAQWKPVGVKPTNPLPWPLERANARWCGGSELRIIWTAGQADF
jgi:hypothetical protein